MDDDWDVEESPAQSGTSTPAVPAVPVVVRAPARARWQGEDEEDEQDDWDASEDEKPKTPTTTAPAPTKKKGGLKQKLAEKERLAAEARERGEIDDLIDTTTEQDRRRQAREREIQADLNVAADLLGVTSVDDPKETLEAILKSKPTSKDSFATLSKQIVATFISRHESNPLFPAFAESLAKDLCESLTAVQTRKVASGLSTLGNTKQLEERDKANGKKKATTKPKLGAVKSLTTQIDTEAYTETFDDGDDFM
ncbi:eukaryotic translation initiation factor 3 subunit J [Naematelia encephala]|uniref:Eukaryotic translation initiation factor 3 subunit J n=1 Tax=Naematelia encephala TaxID=71784 RepID=A0A1Y2BN77_9TREE|nr:eukaryotic translation initiation factor 3 subunit J [Naematelia encephala]